MFPKEVYINRRKSLCEIIKSGLILFIGNSDVAYNYPSNIYRFRQDSNFLYFFGIDRPEIAAIVFVEKNEAIVFSEVGNDHDIIWSGTTEDIGNIAESVGVATVLPLKSLKETIEKAQKEKLPIHYLLGYRGDTKIQLAELLNIPIAQLNINTSQILIEAIINLRSKKDNYEIEEIERMVDLAFLMHTKAMELAKPGMKEQGIAGIIEGICLSDGYSVSFPIICSIQSEILHNPNYFNTLKAGQMLLTDAGSESFMHYASDITRVSPVDGKFSEVQKNIYQIVLEANLAAIQLSKPGIYYKDVHLKVARHITNGLKLLGLMKGNVDEAVNAGAHALFFPHGLGHMLGLDVHDMEGLGEDNVGYINELKRSQQFGLANLRMARKLETGFVVTDEPGIYFIPALIDKWQSEKKFIEFINYSEVNKFKGFGGIRIEDDILITENGCRVLGKPIPKTITEIEEICNK
jgi:Xaa-Pro aminopeptidase